jgi:hypothetical protein
MVCPHIMHMYFPFAFLSALCWVRRTQNTVRRKGLGRAMVPDWRLFVLGWQPFFLTAKDAKGALMQVHSTQNAGHRKCWGGERFWLGNPWVLGWPLFLSTAKSAKGTKKGKEWYLVEHVFSLRVPSYPSRFPLFFYREGREGREEGQKFYRMARNMSFTAYCVLRAAHFSLLRTVPWELGT